MTTWGSITKVKARYEDVFTDAPVTDDPSGFKLLLQEVSQFANEFGFTGGDPSILTPEDVSFRLGPYTVANG